MQKIMMAALAGSAISIAAPGLAESFNGPFIGVELTRDAYELKAKNVDLGGGNQFSFDGISGNGVGGGIYLGYDHALGSQAFAGVEASANIAGGKISAALPGLGHGKIKANHSFGLSGRLGFKPAENIGIYTRLGWERTRFKANLTDITTTVPSQQSGKTSRSAFAYGLGLEAYLSENMSLRAEYNIQNYGSAGINKELGIKGIKVDNGQVSLGLAYRF